MEKKKIVALVGSNREKSFNLQLAKITKEIIGDRADFEIVDFKEVPMFNEDIENPAPKAVTELREKVKNSDAMWIFTPEYNHFIPAYLKNVIDWLSRRVEGYEGLLSMKPVAISGASIGMYGSALAQDNLVVLLSSLNMKIMNSPKLAVPNAKKQSDEYGNLLLKDSKEFLIKQIDAFLKFI